MKKFTKRSNILTKKTAAELIQEIPEKQLEDIGKEFNVDYNVSRLYGNLVFQLLLYGMLRSNRLSTHVLEDLYNAPFFGAFSGKGGHQTRHSSLADRLSSLPHEYFESIYEWTRAHFQKELKVRPAWLEKLEIFDSTLVAIGGGLVDWGMRVGPKPKEGNAKVQLKITLGLKGWLPGSVRAFTKQKALSEEHALKQAIVESTRHNKDFIAFDQGLQKRQSLAEFDEARIGFVTRCQANVRYQKVETYRQIKGRKSDGLRFIQDSKVYLYGSGKKLFKTPFRLIEAERIEDGEKLFFLTNLWEFSAMQIARIYRHRWDIEVFFRFLKQELNMKHLINRTYNGIMIQIYAALITAILLVVFKKTNNISSYKSAKILFVEQLLFSIFKELEKIPPSERRLRGLVI